MNDIKLQKARFTIDDENYFEGYYDPSDDWNGFAIPAFDWHNAVRIAAWINDPKHSDGMTKAVVHEGRKVIELIDEDGSAIFEGPLYAIGASSWCWTVK